VIEAGLALLFGLLIGSFLNVCIHRWPRDLSVVRPRSRCPKCETPIAWYDNVPLVSFVVLGGRCRHCGVRISWRYPLVEVLTGALFCVYVLTFGPTLAALKYCILGALLVGLMFADLEERILPDEMTLGGLAVGLVFSWFVPVKDLTGHALLWLMGFQAGPQALSVAESAIGAFLPAFFLWFGGWVFEKVRHKEGLGFGDVKLIAMTGAFLGTEGALLTLILGSVAGSIIGYSYIFVTKKDAGSYELPFGTFLGAAGIAVTLAGHKMLSWYLSRT
jgi:leader peptidase (prepilin peptidase) / N-methyltransferase